MAGAALSQEELGQKLLAALGALYAASSAAGTRRAANEWLSNFRFTEEAWMISHALLARGPTFDNTEVGGGCYLFCYFYDLFFFYLFVVVVDHVSIFPFTHVGDLYLSRPVVPFFLPPPFPP
jgi:hypothetical protein